MFVSSLHDVPGSNVLQHVAQSYADLGIRDLMHEGYTHTLQDNIAPLAQAPLAFHPGESWLYAHASHDILAALIERFSGLALDTYLQQHLFEPLGMHETWFFLPQEVRARLPEVSLKGNATQLYDTITLGMLPMGKNYGLAARPANRRYFSPGGGLHGTATDYFKFAQMLLDGGLVKKRVAPQVREGISKEEVTGEEFVRVLNASTVSLMTSPQSPHLNYFTHNRWGYSVDVQTNEHGHGYDHGHELDESCDLGGVGSYGWRGIWSTLWNNDPSRQSVTLAMSQVDTDGLFPRLYDLSPLVRALLAAEDMSEVEKVPKDEL